MTAYPVLTATTFLPFVGAALILLFGSERLARWIALATTLATVAVSESDAGYLVIRIVLEGLHQAPTAIIVSVV